MPTESAKMVKCEVCGTDFIPSISDEENREWYEKTFGRPYNRAEVMEVCSKCYYAMIAFSQTVSTTKQ